jgi:leucine dehydrogenase
MPRARPARSLHSRGGMSVFTSPHFDDHEQVSFHADAASGLRMIVAIHTTGPLGMAGGGCRMWGYPRDEDALIDALRLSRDMSFKLALAGIPSGGAKSVVIGVAPAERREAVLRAVGRAVEQLRGRYVIAEDVGTSPDDMRVIHRETNYVVPEQGDSGPSTAMGVLRGIEVSVRRGLDRDLEGLRVAVQGLGRVGSVLARELKHRGAALWLCDVDDARASALSRELGAEKVAPSAFAGLDVDVLAPCALSDVVTEDNVASLRARVIAGSANNVLASPAVAERLMERGILYAPDFVINMGGVIGASQNDPEAFTRIDTTLESVFDLAEREAISTQEAAERLAREAIAAMRR